MAYKLWYERFPFNVLTWILMLAVWAWIGIARLRMWWKNNR